MIDEVMKSRSLFIGCILISPIVESNKPSSSLVTTLYEEEKEEENSVSLIKGLKFTGN